MPGSNGTTLSAGTTITNQTFSALGLSIWLDSSLVRPGTTNTGYPLALLDVGTIGNTEDWVGLRTDVTTATLVALPMDSLSPYLRPARTPYKLHIAFPPGYNSRYSCVSALRLLRTYDQQHRMGASVREYDVAGELLDERTYGWQLTLRTNIIDVSLTSANVAHIVIEFSGFGYGAMAFIQACYPNTQPDPCGVCAGNGSSCGWAPPPTGPTAGEVCFNESMSNYACRAGRYDTTLQCVPNLFNVTREVCNGVDDDCDGIIDNGAPVTPVTCGIGACENTIYLCQGSLNASAVCVPGEPSVEVCNNIDDDCDGQIDEGGVCDRPIEGVPVIPTVACVEGRLSPSPTLPCYAHFGYVVREMHLNVTLPYPSPVNSIAYPLATSVGWAPSQITAPPTFFAPNASAYDAFRVQLPACTGVSAAAVWIIGDGQGHTLEASAIADQARPCETGAYTPTELITRPISVFVDDPCVRRSKNGTCQVSMGYFNPNPDVQVAYIPLSPIANALRVELAGAATNLTALVAPPNVFFAQRVRNAIAARWPCPTGAETLRWRLVSGANPIAREAIASKLCPTADS